jgi:hypothetical protein
MKIQLKILFAILLVFSVGCDIFEVRDPENPTDTRSGYIVPVQPSDVIQNLITSFRERNANDYRKNFAEGPPVVDRVFYFVPSGNVVSSFPSEWFISEEFQYFNNLITRTPQGVPINLSFTGEQFDIQGDSAIYSAGCSLSVPVQNTEPQIFEGSLKFTMTIDNNRTWVIYFWEDIALPDKNSWSALKVEFY